MAAPLFAGPLAELDAFDGCVVAGDQPSRPAAKALADGIDFRAPIHTDNREAVSGPTASIPVVIAGRIDLDGIPRGGIGRGTAGRRALVSRAHAGVQPRCPKRQISRMRRWDEYFEREKLASRGSSRILTYISAVRELDRRHFT